MRKVPAQLQKGQKKREKTTPDSGRGKETPWFGGRRFRGPRNCGEKRVATDIQNAGMHMLNRIKTPAVAAAGRYDSKTKVLGGGMEG